MLGHKTSLNKFKKIGIVSNIFSNHNGMKLEINFRKKKTTHTWRLNKMLLKTNESKKSEKISKNTLRRKKNRNTTFQNLWDKAKAVLRKDFTVI